MIWVGVWIALALVHLGGIVLGPERLTSFGMFTPCAFVAFLLYERERTVGKP